MPKRNPWRPLWSIVILVVVNMLIFGWSAGYEFVNYDDPRYVSENPLVTVSGTDSLKRIFTEPYFSNYQPLVLLSYKAERRLFGPGPGAYHVTNIIFHTANCVLVLFLVLAITKKQSAALIVALIFALHPLQVESVAWVSERKGLMCAFFFLLSFLSYVRFARERKKSAYLSSLLFFLLSLLSKPMSVTLPVILILFDYCENRLSKTRILEKAPYFLLAAGFAVLTILVQSDVAIDMDRYSLYRKFFYFPFYNIAFYTGKLLFPNNLSVYYGYPGGAGFLSFGFAVSVLVVAGIAVYLANLRKVPRAVNFGVLFFLVSLLPILRIIPIGNTVAADRYMYIPLVGFFLAPVVAVDQFSAGRARVRRAAVAAASVYIVYLAAFSFQALRVWENSEKLWSNVIKYYPEYYNAHIGIGDYFLERGEPARAREHFSKALETEDRLGRELALYVVGLAYYREKNLPMAERFFHDLVTNHPANRAKKNLFAYLYLGDISVATNRHGAGKAYYEAAIKTAPESPRAHYAYGTFFELRKDYKSAEKHYLLAARYAAAWDLPKKALQRLGRAAP